MSILVTRSALAVSPQKSKIDSIAAIVSRFEPLANIAKLSILAVYEGLDYTYGLNSSDRTHELAKVNICLQLLPNLNFKLHFNSAHVPRNKLDKIIL